MGRSKAPTLSPVRVPTDGPNGAVENDATLVSGRGRRHGFDLSGAAGGVHGEGPSGEPLYRSQQPLEPAHPGGRALDRLGIEHIALNRTDIVVVYRPECRVSTPRVKTAVRRAGSCRETRWRQSVTTCRAVRPPCTDASVRRIMDLAVALWHVRQRDRYAGRGQGCVPGGTLPPKLPLRPSQKLASLHPLIASPAEAIKTGQLVCYITRTTHLLTAQVDLDCLWH